MQNEGTIIQWRGTWVTSTAYAIGDMVTHTKTGYGTCVFLCILAHTSDSTSEPVVGASRDTYWAEYILSSAMDVLTFPATVQDRISLYGSRIGETNGYCLGVESSSMYYKAGTYFRWYLNCNADAGVSHAMELSATALNLIASGTVFDIIETVYGVNAPSLIGKKARGTRASPSAVQTDDAIFNIGAKGYATTGFTLSSRALISLCAAENWTDSTKGTYISFWVTAIGADTRIERARICPAGGFAIGSTSDPGAGNLYASGNVSAASFTDRTPAYAGDALSDLRAISEKDGKIDHSTLPEFARKTLQMKDDKGQDIEGIGRDLGAMISILTKAVTQLAARLEQLETKLMQDETKPTQK